MVLNYLDASQAKIAHIFSRADLYPKPFLTIPHELTADGLPLLTGSRGAMSCKLVSKSIPLHDFDNEGAGIEGQESEPVVSELFIARVVRVETSAGAQNGEPLLYHDRRYKRLKRQDDLLETCKLMQFKGHIVLTY
jgi:flavin reductase (DIM6/NTAB) family NADH-FMN oxidoreductase RutF